MEEGREVVPVPRGLSEMVGASEPPFQEFMNRVIREYFGYRPGDPDPAQRSAVSACYRRFGRAAKDIMAFALNDPQKAWAGVKAIGDRMEQSCLSWNLDTVARWFPDWMIDPKAYEAETRDQGMRRR